MAFSINGVGTAYIGKRRLEDGSFITTKWVCIFVPIFPLYSFRVTAKGFATGPWNNLRTPMRGHRVPMDWQKVAKIYKWESGIAAIIGVLAAAYRLISS